MLIMHLICKKDLTIISAQHHQNEANNSSITPTKTATDPTSILQRQSLSLMVVSNNFIRLKRKQ
jgi:hypothetical protein